MQIANNFGYAFQHVAFTLSRQSDQLLHQRLGIGLSQFKILMVLEQQPYIQQRQIADTLGQTEASISRQIKLMTKKGLLQSKRSPSNRRQNITTPTSKGLVLLDTANELLNQYHKPMFESLNQSQQKYLAESISEMHKWSCQSGKTGACDHPYS
jgi:DNA-binding MarR family transcriptional regulator